MDDLTHHNAELGDVRLHYVTMGEGFPVVLLHGWPQELRTGATSCLVSPPSYRVIAPDLRGLGGSVTPTHGLRQEDRGQRRLAACCKQIKRR